MSSSDSGEEDAPISGPAGGALSPPLAERLGENSADGQRQWNGENRVAENHDNSQHTATEYYTAQHCSSAPGGAQMDNTAYCHYSRHNMNALAGRAGNRGHLVSTAGSYVCTDNNKIIK